MTALGKTWRQLASRHAALNRRERMLVAVALVLGPLLIGNALFIEPQWSRAKALEQSIATGEATQAQLLAQVETLQALLRADPDAARRAELAAQKALGEEAEARLRELGSVLVRPEKMNDLLQGLLARHAGLRLVSLKTLPPEGVLGDRERAKDGAGKPVERQYDLYRHGVEICVEGSYGELQAWLAQLEKLPQRLLWERLDYRVLDYPRAEMRLTVFTLSPEKTWLVL